MPPNHFESEVESFLEGSHGDRTHNKQQADHHTVTPLCGTLLKLEERVATGPRQLLESPSLRFCPQLAASGGVSLVAALACKDDTLIPCCRAACARLGVLWPRNALRVFSVFA